jgi:hypothetical protein
MEVGIAPLMSSHAGRSQSSEKRLDLDAFSGAIITAYRSTLLWGKKWTRNERSVIIGATDDWIEKEKTSPTAYKSVRDIRLGFTQQIGMNMR